MDNITAFAMGSANRGNEMKVFDWDKAARLIIEHKANAAAAGLSGDWEWTGGTIYKNGRPDKKSYTYLASTWATPEIEIGGEFFDCYVMESKTEWDAHTKWPDSALSILSDNGQ
jgi:hypothetical protein